MSPESKNVLLGADNFRKNIYDVLVIGGGTSGVYCTEAARRFDDRLKIAVLEQRSIFGGDGLLASLQQARTYQSDLGLIRLIQETIQFHQEDKESISELAYLFVFRNSADIQSAQKQLELLKTHGIGQRAEMFDPAQLRSEYPWVDKEEVRGALYYPEAYSIDFARAIERITRMASNTTFALGTMAGEILIENGRAIGVKTNLGVVHAKHIILAPGPFILKYKDIILGGQTDRASLLDQTNILRRIRFSAPLSNLAPEANTQTASTKFVRIFIIDNTSKAYVRVVGDHSQRCEGLYGWADPGEPSTNNPLLCPPSTDELFPATVFSHLGNIISRYGDDIKPGPFATRPNSSKAGYYVETKDDKPFASETAVGNLWVLGGLSHYGVMAGYGVAKHLVSLIMKETSENPYSIFRTPQGHSDSKL